MSAPRTDWVRACPECGATLVAPATQCWLCRRPLPGEAPQPDQALPATAESGGPFPEAGTWGVVPQAGHPEHRARFQFGLASLMLMVTLVALILSVTVMAPGLGIALAVVVAPALVLTAVTAARSEAAGRAMTTADKLWCFAAAMGAALITVVAAAGAFFGTCVVGFGLGAAGGGMRSEIGPVTGIVLGGIAALVVFFSVFRGYLRSFAQRKPRNRP